MPMKVAFLDRDGVINAKPYQDADVTEYVTHAQLFKFNPGIFELLRHLANEGFQFIVITNQRGIALGRMTLADLEAVHAHMRAELERQGIRILDIFFCPHDHDACSCRKPRPGMLQSAMEKYDIDLARSILISDSWKDVEMGVKFGIGRSILIYVDHPEMALKGVVYGP